MTGSPPADNSRVSTNLMPPNPRQMADDFVARVTAPACAAAKHRKAAMLEVRDLQLVLEKQWGIKIPGVGPQKPPLKVWLADVTNK